MGKTMRLPRSNHIVLGFLTAVTICLGCKCNRGASSAVSKDISTSVLLSRNLETGRFQAFVMKDQAVLKQLRDALQQDLTHSDGQSWVELGMSVNHVLALRSKDGKTSLFKILGDHFIVVDSIRYPAERTLAVWNDARLDGAACAISPEDAKRLAPALNGYLRNVSEPK